MFQDTYNFFNHELTCYHEKVGSWFKLENDSYSYIKHVFQAKGWKYHRIDTVNAQGFPDILLLKGPIYLSIESKRLKKKQLNSIENDLKWQFGQLGYMKRSLSLELNYILSVVKDNHIAYIGDKLCLEKYL